MERCKVCSKKKSKYNYCPLCNACRLKAVHCDMIDFESVTKKKLNAAMKLMGLTNQIKYDNIF